MIQKSYKYRIYPNKKQQELFKKHLNCVRFIYNWGLEKKIKAYQKNKKQISCFELIIELTKLKKKKDYQWLNEVNSQSLQMALRNLDNAFTAFFRKNSRFPKFKSKKQNKNSFQVPQFLKLGKRLGIPKIPNIKIKLDRKNSTRRALFTNMAESLIIYEKITTTKAKAKQASSLVEKLITKAKKQDLNARRDLISILYTKNVINKLMDVLGPRYKDVKGGFTRTTTVKNRVGDGAIEVVLELV